MQQIIFYHLNLFFADKKVKQIPFFFKVYPTMGPCLPLFQASSATATPPKKPAGYSSIIKCIKY